MDLTNCIQQKWKIKFNSNADFLDISDWKWLLQCGNSDWQLSDICIYTKLCKGWKTHLPREISSWKWPKVSKVRGVERRKKLAWCSGGFMLCAPCGVHSIFSLYNTAFTRNLFQLKMAVGWYKYNTKNVRFRQLIFSLSFRKLHSRVSAVSHCQISIPIPLWH